GRRIVGARSHRRRARPSALRRTGARRRQSHRGAMERLDAGALVRAGAGGGEGCVADTRKAGKREGGKAGREGSKARRPEGKAGKLEGKAGRQGGKASPEGKP